MTQIPLDTTIQLGGAGQAFPVQPDLEPGQTTALT